MMPPDQTLTFVGGTHHPDPADLSLFAMRLLPGDQANAIREHLPACADCRAELARIQGDLTLTSLTVDLDAPSPDARQRLLNQVAREKKIVPPPAAPVASVQPSAAQPVAAQPRPVVEFGRSGSILQMEESKPKGRAGIAVLAGLGWAAAAGISLFAGSLLRDRQTLHSDLVARTGQVQRLTADAAAAHRLMDALTDPGAQRVSMSLVAQPRPKGQPSAGVTYNPDKGSLIFLASNLNPLEQYKAYELWIIPSDNSAPIPVGTFHPDRQGNASIVMPDLPKEVPAKAFAVTVEPDGGSQIPTMPLVMFGN
ncbi:MAG TPA: anti-sigma factor [Acidobacteriaceae bacterium]|nr:anti-sigma factor [Acidobacteriaceae bacterium]